MTTYLDHNATTPVNEQVLEAMLPYLKESFGNPSTLYSKGREAKQAINHAREQVAQLAGAHPSQIIFTSGGTEANNIALKGISNTSIAVSAIEHPSVIEPARQLEKSGKKLAMLAVDENGELNLDDLEQKLMQGVNLVSVMWANNETGVTQKISRVYDICQRYGTVLHSDAVQMAGKMALDFSSSNLDLMSLSSHKLYGPKGVGALVVNKEVEIEPLVSGGGQERGLRSGTENVAAIVGFGAAAELAFSRLDALADKMQSLRDLFEDSLKKEISEVRFFSQGVERVPNTSMFSIPGYEGQTLVMGLDNDDIAASSGSACGSHHKEPSKVLNAMGVDSDIALGAVRVSFGDGNSEEDVKSIVNSIVRQVKSFQKMGALAW